MDQVWGWLIGATIGGAVMAFYVAPTVRAFKTPSSDLRRIQADFAHLPNGAGAGKQVIDITRTGTLLPTSFKGPRRLYSVTVQRADGSTERWSAEIIVRPLGRGAMISCRQ